MSLSAAQLATANKALDDIESQRMAAWNVVLTTWAADDAARDASVSYLGNQVPQLIANLRKQLDTTAEAHWVAWVDAATNLQHSIADVVGYADNGWSMRSVLLDAGQQTAVEVKNIAEKGLFAGVGAFTFLVLGVIAWKVLK